MCSSQITDVEELKNASKELENEDKEEEVRKSEEYRHTVNHCVVCVCSHR